MKTWNTCTCSKLTMQCHCFHHGMLCCSGSVLTWTWLPVLVRTLYIYIRLDLLIDDPVRPDALHHVVELLLLLLSPVHHFLLVVVPTAHVQAVVIRRGTYSQITSCLQIEKKHISLTKKDNSWCFDCKVHYASTCNTKCVKYCKMEFIKKKRKTKTAQFKHFIPYV